MARNNRASSRTDWEYREFIYQEWQPDQVWITLGGNNPRTAAYARSFLWNTVKDNITDELRRWCGEGWELVDEIGSQSLSIRAAETVGPRVDGSDVALWLLTGGLALVMRLILGNPPRVYATYRPAEFRVQVRRPRVSLTEPLVGCVSG